MGSSARMTAVGVESRPSRCVALALQHHPTSGMRVSASPTIDDILVTDRLWTRPAAVHDVTAEHAALVELAALVSALSDNRQESASRSLLARLVALARELCGAGSAGVSLLEMGAAEAQLRWVALAGAYSSLVGGTVPGDFSPCGECLRRDAIQLYEHPARVFPYLSSVSPPIVECLVVPLRCPNRLVGTIWVVTHSPARTFTRTEARALTTLAGVTAAVLELVAARDAAEHASRVKDEFLAIASHELQAPAAAILGWAELLLSGRLEASRAAQALSAIHHQAGIQAMRVGDLLDTARAATGRLRLTCEPCSLNDIVMTAVAMARPAASVKSLRLHVAESAAPIAVDADVQRLLQVLGNVLDNAVTFTPAGGSIHVAVGGQGGRGTVSVTDTGEGIRADFLPHVFGLFRQADASTTRPTGGLGVGLYVAKHIVNQHGGSIDVRSGGTGQGTTVRMSLPLAVSDERRRVGT